MKYRELGQTGVKVSEICLGTMTWGEQNTQAEAFEQMDYAIDSGINFFDAAEMYPVPPRPETQGATETIIGHWLAARGRRDELVLATKVAGRGDRNNGTYHLRQGPRLSRDQVLAAMDASLTRLQTDYVDLYQVHWPERATNFFGKLGYEHVDNDGIDIHETLEALAELVDAGKVRYVGISNETPWGVMRYLNLAKEYGLPVIASIQNPYNLLNRTFEIGLAEMAIRERVGLLAYSPLAFGVLSGKYLNGQKPPASRLALFERFTRYASERCAQAAADYVAIAQQHGLDPAQMALAYVNGRPFVTSTIIGATTMEQLRSDIGSAAIELSAEVIADIEKVHAQNPNPAP